MRYLLILLIPLTLLADVRVLTLRELLDAVLAQNPEVALSRLEEDKANDDIALARDPFHPKVVVGSGLAKNFGFPMSIEGSAPSVIQAKAIASIFDRPQSYRVQAARERKKISTLDTEAKRDEIAHRAASLYLEALRLNQALRVLRSQVDNLTLVETSVQSRVGEGRDLPIDSKRASLRLLQAKQRVRTVETEVHNAEVGLAAIAGLGVNDLVRPKDEELQIPTMHLETEDSAVAEALLASNEIRKFETGLVAKGWEVKAGKAANLPKIDLVAQYGLFAKFNNYEDYFRNFQRHNGILGVSLQLPILTGSASRAMASQANADISRLRLQMSSARNRISSDVRRAWQDVERSQTSTELARLELDLQRDEVSRILALLTEGKATQKQLEEMRYLENEKWVALFDSRFGLERARLELLRQTGTMLAQLRP